MSILFVPENLRRITSRGWRSNGILLISFVLGSAFLVLLLGGSLNDSPDIRVVHSEGTQHELPSIPEVSFTLPDLADLKPGSITTLDEVLRNIIIDAALQYRPDAKDARDMDIAHLARQTAVMKDLLRIYEKIPSTSRESQQEQAAFRHTIETMQQTLYPWITQAKDGNRTYNSFFDLINSFEQDAGIVISTGKDGGFRWAVHQIVTLRAVLNSTLPIEVFYGGDNDLPKQYRNFINALAVAFPDSGTIKTVDITKKFPDPDGILDLPGGWAMRPFAILASSFKTAILADADTIFVQDPRILLDEVSYKEYGSIFWHDRTLTPAPEETYKWADELLEAAKAKHMDKVTNEGWFKHQTYYEMESGAVVVDKVRNLPGALATCYMNSKKFRDEIMYRKTYGDKESYWLAHALTSSPYHFVPGYSGAIGRITHPKDGDRELVDQEELCTLQLLHTLESTGEPLWFNNAITEYKGADDAHYIVPEGWVPHEGRWHGGATRFPNEFCVSMPETSRDKLLGLPEPVHRIEGDLKWRLERMLEVVLKYDGLMEREELIKINR